MSLKPTAPQSIGQVLDTSFRVFRVSWAHVWLLALLGALAGYAGDAYQLFAAGLTESKSALVIVLTIAGSIASIAFYSAIYLRQDVIASGQAPGGEVATGFKLLPRLILMSIAMFLVIAASALPLCIFVYMAFFSQGWPVWLGAVGVAVLCIPPLYFIINMVLGTVVLLVENRRAIESLKTSTRLVRGNWWRTFIVLTVGGIILMVAYALVGVAAGIAAPLLSVQESTVTVLFAAVVAMILVGLVVTPYFIALMMALYYDLKLRKEGGDIAARIDSMT